jgi:putative transposase
MPTYDTQSPRPVNQQFLPPFPSHGHVEAILAQRKQTLDAAYATRPERFVRKPPTPLTPPTTVGINMTRPTQPNPQPTTPTLH